MDVDWLVGCRLITAMSVGLLASDEVARRDRSMIRTERGCDEMG